MRAILRRWCARLRRTSHAPKDAGQLGMSTTFALPGRVARSSRSWPIRQRHRFRKRREEDWGGEALRGKPLIFSERLFRSSRTGIVAKIDRGYLADGSIHLLEFKTRRRHAVYPADIIELSAQRVAVQDDDGRRVTDDGYVLTRTNGTAVGCCTRFDCYPRMPCSDCGIVAR